MSNKIATYSGYNGALASSKRLVNDQRKGEVVVSKQIRAIELFKIPRRKEKKVLEEEKFIEGLEKIIIRDYCPELKKIQEFYKWKQEMIEDATSKFSHFLDKDSLYQDKDDFDHKLEDLTLNQYLSKYVSEDNRAFEEILQKDREAFVEKYSWIFNHEEYFTRQNLAIKSNENNRLMNMLESSRAPNLVYHKNDPLSIFHHMDRAHWSTVQSHSDPNSYLKKRILKENTRFDASQILMNANENIYKRLKLDQTLSGNEKTINKFEFSENVSQSTPNILGQKNSDIADDNSKNSTKNLQESKKPTNINDDSIIRVPSPDPTSFKEPIMTWGEIVTKPVQLGGKRFVFSFAMEKDQNKPQTQETIEHKKNDPFEFFLKRPEREAFAHDLANKLMKKRALEPAKKKLEQMKNMLTPKSSASGMPSTPTSIHAKSKSRLSSSNISIKHLSLFK